MKKLLQSGLCLLALAFAHPARAADSVVINGDFEAGINGWVGYLVTVVNDQPSVAQKDSFLLWENRDTAVNSKGSLRGILQFEPATPATSHNCGVVANLKKEFPANSVLKLAFQAKSISGSIFLSTTRMGGGGKWVVVELKPTWEKYEIEVPVQVAGTQIIFCSVVGKDAHTLAANGEFLLDDLSVEIIPPKSAN